MKCSNRVGRNFRHDRSTVPVSTNHTQDSPSLRLSSQNINLDVNLNLNNLENETLPNTTPPPPLYRLPLRQIPPPQKSPPTEHGPDMSVVDKKIFDVYGKQMHDLSAADIPSSIPEDKIWQDRWTTLVNLPTQRYDLPSGAVGRRFIKMLTTEMAGIKARKWNSERMIVFTIVMLQRERDVIKRRDIIKRITKRMDLWEAKKHSTLINDTLRSNLTLQKPRKKSTEPADHTEKVFARLLLQGKLRQAVRWVTGREKGGVLHPTDIDAKTGKPVAEVLESRHPVPMDTKIEDLQGF